MKCNRHYNFGCSQCGADWMDECRYDKKIELSPEQKMFRNFGNLLVLLIIVASVAFLFLGYLLFSFLFSLFS